MTCGQSVDLAYIILREAQTSLFLRTIKATPVAARSTLPRTAAAVLSAVSTVLPL